MIRHFISFGEGYEDFFKRRTLWYGGMRDLHFSKLCCKQSMVNVWNAALLRDFLSKIFFNVLCVKKRGKQKAWNFLLCFFLELYLYIDIHLCIKLNKVFARIFM